MYVEQYIDQGENFLRTETKASSAFCNGSQNSSNLELDLSVHFLQDLLESIFFHRFCVGAVVQLPFNICLLWWFFHRA